MTAGAASFRHVGEVRAEQLVADMKWRNASGDELSLRPVADSW